MPALVPADSGDTSAATTVPTLQVLADSAVSPATTTASTITLTATDRGIPARMLAAYQQTADDLARDVPGCHLPWELLAAIGKVESGHAHGHPITADGTITRPILGPALNGTAGVALIRDTDHGTLDHDTVYDRAVGPLQFIPTTWTSAGRDGNHDGRRDPHNIHDATLAAGHYLCAHGRDLTHPDQLRAAILAYNPSNSYLRTVLTWMNGYQQNSPTAVPDTPTPSTSPTTDPPAASTSPAHPPTTEPARSPDPDLPAPAFSPTPRVVPGVTIIPLTPRTPDPTPPTTPSAAPTTPTPPVAPSPPATPPSVTSQSPSPSAPEVSPSTTGNGLDEPPPPIEGQDGEPTATELTG